MLNRRHILTSFLALPALSAPAFADVASVFSMDGLAIRGIDPVSYFDNTSPQMGQAGYRLKWHGAIWQFASAQTMARFERDPHGLSPQYGGYCAVRLSQGALSPTLPDAWALHASKLYLAHSVSARDRWKADPERYLALSEAHWPSLINH